MDKKSYELAVELRHELHTHPELSMNEQWTKQRIMRFIGENTKLEVIDRGHWFYAYYKSDNKEARNIAYRADMDAVPVDEEIDVPYASKVPGCAHKCGHDGHCASLAGFAVDVDRNGAKNNIYFIFQHAEEIGVGGMECAQLIDEKHIDEVYAYHNYPMHKKGVIYVTNGVTNFASKGIVISMTGVKSHASLPELGRNPAYAIANIVASLPDLAGQVRYSGLALCTVIQIDVGECAFGTSAGSGRLLLTIRAEHEEEMEMLQRDIELAARREAAKYLLDLSIEYQDSFPETRNNPECAEKIRNACGRSWIQCAEMTEPMRASEDFGYYLKKTKGAIFYIGDGEEYTELHTPKFDFPDALIEIAAEVFSALANS